MYAAIYCYNPNKRIKISSLSVTIPPSNPTSPDKFSPACKKGYLIKFFTHYNKLHIFYILDVYEKPIYKLYTYWYFVSYL